MAQTQAITCASRGASMNVPDDLDQLTCAHCGTALSVVAGPIALWAARKTQAFLRRELQGSAAWAPTPYSVQKSFVSQARALDWSAFWRWARVRGISDFAALEATLGYDTSSMTPAEIKAALVAKYVGDD